MPEIPAPPTMGTDLNFLKPGSREVLHRPVYVHEYMPPMFPELENEPDEHPQVNGELVRDHDFTLHDRFHRASYKTFFCRLPDIGSRILSRLGKVECHEAIKKSVTETLDHPYLL